MTRFESIGVVISRLFNTSERGVLFYKAGMTGIFIRLKYYVTCACLNRALETLQKTGTQTGGRKGLKKYRTSGVSGTSNSMASRFKLLDFYISEFLLR